MGDAENEEREEGTGILYVVTLSMRTKRERVPLSAEPSGSLCGALGSIPSTAKKEEEDKGRRRKRKEKRETRQKKRNRNREQRRAQPTNHVFIELIILQIPMVFFF